MIKNKFFEINKSKKIIASKDQSANFCSRFVSKCLYSNPQNYYNKYIDTFKFDKFDYIIKKTHNENSILFHYLWKIGFEIGIFDNYNLFTFHKVKMQNDVKNFANLIINTDFDIYFLHSIFPHKPFVFSLDESKKECIFDEKKLDPKIYRTANDLLKQHYLEIICTNYYLDSFMQYLEENIKDRYNILFVSDTGTKTSNTENNKFLRDNYSVLFAIKEIGKDFSISKEFISSQELFARYFDPSYNQKSKIIENKKIYDDRTNLYFEVDNFFNTK